MEPISITAILQVLGGGGGVLALWKIAFGLGRFEARITTILGSLQRMIEDHELRIRDMEQRAK